MPKVDFGAARKQAESAGLLSSGDYLKLKEGDNRIRLMSPCLAHNSTYEGKKNFKWLCYVIDRRDGNVKPFFMPHRIYKQIEALQLNEDYSFTDVPMPYDLTINAVKAGTKDVVYTLLPARRETPLTEADLDALADMKPLEDLQKTLNEKAAKNGGGEASQAPVEHADDYSNVGVPLTDDDIPFAWLLPIVMPLVGASLLLVA